MGGREAVAAGIVQSHGTCVDNGAGPKDPYFAAGLTSVLPLPLYSPLFTYSFYPHYALRSIAWKYACSRYTTGTPNFLVNGLPVAADPSWTLAQWQQLLDPLYSASAAKAARRAAVKASGVC